MRIKTIVTIPVSKILFERVSEIFVRLASKNGAKIFFLLG
jgi:hypothetical protein